MTCRRFAALTIVVALAGLVLTSADWDPTNALFFLVLVLILLAAMGGVCWYFAGKRATLDDAFEVGYEAGFRRGERVRPKVIQMPSGLDRERSSRRPREPS